MLKLYITKLKPSEKPHDAAMRALDKAIFELCGKRATDYKIDKTRLGKPFFADCEKIKFSLSHSGEYAAAAVADMEVGVDIERVRPVSARVVQRFLSGIVAGSSDEDIIEAWCKKESYGKFVGTGLVGADFSKPHFMLVFDCIPGYKIAVCSAKEQTAEIVVF
ncbi:MAG TPA: hypothetical protein PK778_04190 [Bacillota bacterium]|nr:hypothetical protein [Clostridiales bacterium]HPT85175.1 hypothetical protein [Bacillota bacterium]